MPADGLRLWVPAGRALPLRIGERKLVLSHVRARLGAKPCAVLTFRTWLKKIVLRSEGYRRVVDGLLVAKDCAC